ncbi:MAG: phytoene desaturase family protein [Candidatus Helarchaeales archaeon]
MVSNPDVIICGAGIAGLLTGAALSKKGLKTLVLEKANRVGGRSQSIEFKKGYIVDYGLHVIRYVKKSPTWKIFKKFLGIKLDLIDLGDTKYFANDTWYDYPLSIRALGTTTLFTQEEKTVFGQILAQDILRAKVEPKLEVDVKSWLDEIEKKYNFYSKNARMFLETLAKFMLVSPGLLDQLSAGELIEGIQTGAKASAGAAYPRGGWKPLIENLCNIIEENGEIRLNTKVDKVIIEDEKVKGVNVGNDKIEAPNVIVNIPCTEIFSILDESLFAPDFVKKCKSMRPSSGIFIDFGLKKKISENSGSNLTAEPFTMSIFTSNIDPSVAPEGEQLYTILQPTMPETLKDKQKCDQIVEGMFKLLEKMFPGFKDSILWKRVSIGHVVDGALPLITQHRNLRPKVKGPFPGLYFTGDTYNGPGTGGEIAHSSALLCIQQVMSDLGIE